MNISDVHLDYIKEILNIGVGRGAGVLNAMLNTHITLDVPDILLFDELDNSILPESDRSVASVDLNFHGELAGVCKLLFPTESALKLVNQVSGEGELNNETVFDPMSEGVLKEIGNIILNSVIGVLCNNLGIQLKYEVPSFVEASLEELFNNSFSDDDTTGLLARIHFSVEAINVHGDVLTVFKMGSFSKLLELIDQQIND